MDGLRTVEEQLHRRGLRQRVERVLRLHRDVQRDATRDEQRRSRRAAQEVRDRGRGLADVLEVVEHEQRSMVLGAVGLGEAERLQRRGEDCFRVGQRRQGDEVSAVRELVRELGGELQGEAGLAGAAGAGDRDEPLPAQQIRDVALLGRTPDERVRGFGQRRPVQAAQRRERVVAELVDPLRPRQVLEPMLAEIDDVVVSPASRSRVACESST